MAMFGKSAARFGPEGLSGADKAILFGAMMKDVGGALSGNDSNAMLQAQSMLAQRQQYAQQQALAQKAAGLFGGQGGSDASAAFGAGVPSRPGGFNSRDAATQLAQFAAQGLDITPYTKLAELAKPTVKIGPDGKAYDEGDPNVLGQRFGNPTNVNGWIKDLNNPNNENTYSPQLPEGMIPDGRGGVTYPNGLVPQLAGREGAVAAAKAAGAAPYEFQAFQGPDGRTITGAKSALAGQVFQGQSPTEALRATSATETAIGLPQSLATSQGALELISQLKKHPGLEARTGLTAVLPPIPGTSGADFDTMAQQLKGKVFLEAFASLKGSGAITEREGEAATNAIARLNQRQTKDGYVSALSDLERVIRSGMDRQQRKAGASSSASPPRSAVEAELRRRGLIR